MASKNDKGDKRGASYSQLSEGTRRSEPILHQNAREIQPYGKIAKLPIALDEKVCAKSAENLNQLLADTMTLRDMYKKHHWQVAGHTFYQLHLLFDKHHGEQDELVDEIAERIQLLGAISLAMAADVAETTIIPTAAARARGSAGAAFAAARSARDHFEGSADDGEAGERGGRRRNE